MSTENESDFKHAVDKTMDAAGGMVGKASASMTSSADSFVESAAISDQYEIEAGRIAQQRATSPQVKEVAAKMVEDHTDSTTKLKRAVEQSGKVSADDMPSKMDSRRQKMIEHLRDAPADKFDETYLDQQVSAHEEAVKLMHHFRDEGDCPQLRSFASEVSPIIEGHLERMKTLSRT
ncbi:DUF4142 domain-containing protein [Aurantiacibacter spongiae]|uniref:DUF4142 domain-containing protein n=1 Tax=Aurantiacibacter spongiae TaxID=2488860 RepID=A0A3N5DMI9_9SPHN|nr:DUF4142 domain-containing protein [Aurantiacibacter spongiae]RPF72085.1 DUF4142 domain-containing protein [Aurantiacibacter spongiae]